MRRILALLSCVAGVVWGGMVGWSVNRVETETRVRVRTGAFVLMIGAGLLAGRHRSGQQQDEEETF